MEIAMKVSDLRPGDVFAYTVMSSAGDYEKHARVLEGGRMRMTATAEEFEIKNPSAPVRLIRREDTDARFKRAWKDLPDCVDADPLATKTLNDLRWACVTQLDLIEEGQDGTEDDDPAAIKRWLKKYGRPEFAR